MQIEFERTGGFLGLRLHTEVNTDQLPDEHAKELITLVRKANLRITNHPTQQPQCCDMFHYKITISEGARSRTACYYDNGIPSEALPLIQFLSEHAINVGQYVSP